MRSLRRQGVARLPGWQANPFLRPPATRLPDRRMPTFHPPARLPDLPPPVRLLPPAGAAPPMAEAALPAVAESPLERRGGFDPPGACGLVLAVNSSTRHLAPATARRAVAAAGRRLRERSPRLVFKKIDSTLRGPVPDEVAAALEVFERRAALVCPAFPAAGRVVRDGEVYVYGKPLRETEYVRDLRTPAPAEPLAALFGRVGPVRGIRPDEASTSFVPRGNHPCRRRDGGAPRRSRGPGRRAGGRSSRGGIRRPRGGARDPSGRREAGSAARAPGRRRRAVRGRLPRRNDHPSGRATAGVPARIRRSWTRRGGRSEYPGSAPGRRFFPGGPCPRPRLLPPAIRRPSPARSAPQYAKCWTASLPGAPPPWWRPAATPWRRILDALGIDALDVLGEFRPGIPVSRAGVERLDLTLVSKAGGFGSLDLFTEIAREAADP